MKRAFSFLFILFFLVVGAGCGNSNDTFVATTGGSQTNPNPTQPSGDTGTLVFDFIQGQTVVPEGTVRLRFDFYDVEDQLVESQERDFAAQIIFEDVSTSVVRVEITGLSSDGFVLATATAEVEVVAGESQQVEVEVEEVTLEALLVNPSPVLLDEDATTTLAVRGEFSDGSIFTLSSQNANFLSNNDAVATVNGSGLVTAVGAGSTTIVVTYTVPGTSNQVTSDPVTVNVTANITLDRLLVTPSPVDVQAGETVNLIIQAEFSDNSTQPLDVMEVTYSGFNDTIATVSNGIVSGVGQGTTTFTARYTVPGAGNEVTSSAITVNVTPPSLDSITVTPDPVCVALGSTEQLVLEGSFSDSSMSSLDSSQATYTGHNTAVATIADGVITPVAVGTTSVVVNFVDPVTSNTIMSSAVPITVVGPALSLTGANTFDTDTGQLNGNVPAGWDGTVLLVAGFDLQSGATLDISGSAAFQVESCGDVTVAGSIDAAGEDAGDASGAAPGSAGLAGAGGFAGGLGGGTDSPNRQGVDGQGPGGGGGGLTLGLSFIPPSTTIAGEENGGGGAGHLVTGETGFSGGGSGTPGAAGPAYVSIPSILRGGSGGGGGSAWISVGGTVFGGGGGGGGGGAVSLIAEGVLNVSGSIDCSGGDGGDNDSGNNAAAGGGGGSGGSIQLLAPATPTVSGTLNVGGGAGGSGVANGGAGAAGRTVVSSNLP